MKPDAARMGDNRESQEKFLFAALFLYANRLQTAGDKLDKVVTMKQWLLIVMAKQFGGEAPTLSELGSFLGCSRQNVKKLALSLEKTGLIELRRDGRALRVVHTEKCRHYFSRRSPHEERFLKLLYQDFDDGEITRLYRGMAKLLTGIERVEGAIAAGTLAFPQGEEPLFERR